MIIDKHADYKSSEKRWERMRDVVAGEDIIHDKGTEYLPQLDDQTDTQYDAYKLRASFFNATDRTVQGMAGLVSRKPIEINPVGESIEDDISHKGVGVAEYAINLIKELLTVGRAGTLVDYPVTADGMTRAQAEENNNTPFWAFYIAETIYDWTFEYVNNQYQLVRVLLFDGIVEDGIKTIYRYRELLLTEKGYLQNLYEGENSIDEPELVDTVIPMISGKVLRYIPFIIHNTHSNPEYVSKPPLLDLANINISHYKLSADHMHALHFIALPTPWVSGVDPDKAPKSVGPSRLWIFEDIGAKAGMLEYTGAGVKSIKDELDSKKLEMAQLGSRALAPEGTTQETATAASIKAMGENSILSGIVEFASKQLSRAWKISITWLGNKSDDAFILLNTDFLPSILSGNDLIALVTSWQSDAISKETLFYNLQRGEVVSGEATFDSEEKLISDNLQSDNIDQGSFMGNQNA